MTALNHQSTIGEAAASVLRPGKRVWILLTLFSGVVFLIGILLSRNMTGPVFYEDGMGYLANARHLAGTRISPELAPTGFYYPGYSMLIAPLYLMPIGPDSIHQGVLLLNAALGSFQFLLGYFFLRRLVGIGTLSAVAASLVAALYPGVLLLQSYAFSDNLFRVVFLGCVIAAGLYFRKESIWRGALLGLLASLAYAVHPRGLGVVAVTAVLLLASAFNKRRTLSALGGLATLVVVTTGLRVVNQLLIEAMYRSDDRSLVDLLSRLLDADFWLAIPIRASGQVWYLAVATAGLLPIGVTVAAIGARRGWRALRRGERASPEDATLSYLLITSAVLFAMAVVFMTPDDRGLQRLDHLVYGRYNDSFVVVFVMLAVSRLVQYREDVKTGDSGLRGRLAIVTIAVMGVAATLLGVLGADDLASGLPFAPTSAIGISAYVDGEAAIPVFVATVGGALLATLVLVPVLEPRVPKRVGFAVLCVAFVGFSFVAEQRVLRGFNEYWMNLLTLDETVDYVGAPEVIGYDEADLSLHGLNGYQFWLDLTDFEMFDSESGEDPPDVDLVIASETWNEAERLEARLIAIEPRLDQGLWVLPGETQNDMAEAGYLLSADPTAQLPDEAMASEVEIVHGLNQPDSLMVGQSRTIQVRVRHLGEGSPWIPMGAWAPSPVEGAVRLVARWIPAGESDVAAVQIAELPRTVLPGEEVTIDLVVSASASDNPLEAGSYTLRLGLIQEGSRWFEDVGDPQLDLELSVTAGS